MTQVELAQAKKLKKDDVNDEELVLLDLSSVCASVVPRYGVYLIRDGQFLYVGSGDKATASIAYGEYFEKHRKKKLLQAE